MMSKTRILLREGKNLREESGRYEHMIKLEEHLKGVNKELASLIFRISNLAKSINDEFPHRRGEADTKNVFGETQLVLDRWANQFIINELRKTDLIKTLASEEESNLIKINENGIFNVALDPLDGTSNIESNNLVATIVGIYEKDLPARGKDLVAAVYILYGPAITMVYTAKNGVHEFLYTPKGFVLRNENIKLPEPGRLYGVGGLRREWTPKFRRFVEWLEGRGYKLRYGGSFVGDFNQILKYGGIFAYPSLLNKPRGKLRLLFEANPVSFIAEQAGGGSSHGKGSILDIKPESIHQRVPAYIGNRSLIERLEEFLNE